MDFAIHTLNLRAAGLATSLTTLDARSIAAVIPNFDSGALRRFAIWKGAVPSERAAVAAVGDYSKANITSPNFGENGERVRRRTFRRGPCQDGRNVFLRPCSGCCSPIG